MKKDLYKLFIENDIQIDEDIFEYGYKILKTYLIFAIITLPLAALFDVIIESILFVILYTPLKKYIGGFHFDSPNLCTFFSIITTVLMGLLIKYYRFTNNAIVFLIVFCLITLNFFAGTVDHPNKRLSELEKKIFKKYTLVIEFLYLLLLIVSVVMEYEVFINVILFSMIFSVGGSLIVYLRNKYF